MITSSYCWFFSETLRDNYLIDGDADRASYSQDVEDFLKGVTTAVSIQLDAANPWAQKLEGVSGPFHAFKIGSGDVATEFYFVLNRDRRKVYTGGRDSVNLGVWVRTEQFSDSGIENAIEKVLRIFDSEKFRPVRDKIIEGLVV